MKHFDYIPELDGPQSFVAAGGRTILCKGGGGGGQGAPYYGNMDRLYGVQSQAAEYMLSNSMPYIPGYMENSNKMVTESMDGTLANQMRQRAGNESTATMGAALAASDRNMQRYGMGFSADRLLTESNRNAIMGAAGKAGAMNDAAARAEDLKWNRNAGALGQATGMGTGAMESVGSAARGYGAAAGNMMQYDALNSAGYGKFGAAVAANAFKDGGSVKKPGLDGAKRYGLGGEVSDVIEQAQPGGFGGNLANKAYDIGHPEGWVGDKMEQIAPGGTLGEIHNAAAPGRQNYLNRHANGGYIKGGKKPGLHLAAGGMPSNNPWTAWQNNNPIQTSQQNQGGGSGLGDAVGAMAMGAAPILVGKGMKAGLSAVKSAMAPAKPAADVAGVVGERGGGAMANGAEGSTASAGADGAVAANGAESTGSGLITGSVESGGVVGQTAGADAATTAGVDAATTAGTDAAVAAGTDAATIAGTDAAVAAGTDAAATVATDVAATAAADAAAVAAADTAATAGAAAVGEAAAAGSAAGPVGTAAGLVVGGLMASGALDGLFARGGNVKRKNFKPGGKVTGKGTETSDDIPAWLSDGEHVNNATSVKLAGLDTLETINNEGLKVRDGQQDAEAAKQNIGKAMIERGTELTAGMHMARGGKVGCKMASGGFTGIALGAGVDEFNKQRILNMEQGLYDLKLKLSKPQVDTLDEQTESNRSIYKLNTARNQAGLDMVPGQTANARKQQQIQGIGLDNTLTGYGAQSLADGNKARGIQIMNDSLAAMPGYNGIKVVDVQPTKDSSGVNYIMSDNSTKFVPAQELQRGIGALKSGDFQFIHDNAGNVYSGNKATGSVTQAVKGDPKQANRQNAPAEIQSAEWLMANVPKYKDNPTAAWEAVRSAREKTRSDFVMDFVSKNAMPGSDINAISQQAGEMYDTLRRTAGSAATSDAPGTSKTGTGKSGVNWQDWAAPPQ